MTSRERVEAAINHRQPDRVPVDLGGMKASGIAVSAYDRLRRRLGLPGPAKVLDARFMIGAVEEQVRQRFGVDVMPLDVSDVPFIGRPDGEWVPRRLFDGREVLFPPGTRIGEDAAGNWLLLDQAGRPTSYRMPRNGYYFDDVSMNSGDDLDPAKFQPVDTIPDEFLQQMADYGRELHQGTDYALLGWGYGVCFLGMSLITERPRNVTMGRPNRWLEMLLTEKETCHEMMGRSVDATIRCLELVNQAVGDYCFAWGIASDDSGTQRGEFVRPDLWAEMIKPHYKRLCDWVHAHTRMKTFFHSCGSVYHLIPHFIEAGIDILNPVQISAARMEPERLVDEYAGKIVFWGGGCDTQQVLPKGTPEDVRGHVRRNLEVFGRGPGGYVLTQVHNIQANVPVENIEAMFDAAQEFGDRS